MYGWGLSTPNLECTGLDLANQLTVQQTTLATLALALYYESWPRPIEHALAILNYPTTNTHVRMCAAFCTLGTPLLQSLETRGRWCYFSHTVSQVTLWTGHTVSFDLRGQSTCINQHECNMPYITLEQRNATSWSSWRCNGLIGSRQILLFGVSPARPILATFPIACNCFSSRIPFCTAIEHYI